MKNEKHANIPIFIPHLGCPHACVFCDQRSISGSDAFLYESAAKTLEKSVRTLGERTSEIAFFGGSFTLIDRGLMEKLLALAARYVKDGIVTGIRLSTRPDGIDGEILDVLEKYGVTAIELGVQSMDETVLHLSHRGHTASQTREAFGKIRARGCFSLVGQMMLGLPGSDADKEETTARAICDMGAQGARIYPTAVLRGTALEDMMKRGEYTPLTLEEAVRRGERCLEIFLSSGVQVLRMGLCAEESCAEAAVAGVSHPAYGELVKSEHYRRILNDYFEKNALPGEQYNIFTAPGERSAAVGYQRSNTLQISERYGCALKFYEDETLGKWQVRVENGTKRALKKA